MDICKNNGWKYIIRDKTGSIPSIGEEYEAMPEKETSDHAEYINEIDYKGKFVHVLKFWEDRVVKGKTIRTEFQWITDIEITSKNAEKITLAERK